MRAALVPTQAYQTKVHKCTYSAISASVQAKGQLSPLCQYFAAATKHGWIDMQSSEKPASTATHICQAGYQKLKDALGEGQYTMHVLAQAKSSGWSLTR